MLWNLTIQRQMFATNQCLCACAFVHVVCLCLLRRMRLYVLGLHVVVCGSNFLGGMHVHPTRLQTDVQLNVPRAGSAGTVKNWLRRPRRRPKNDWTRRPRPRPTSSPAPPVWRGETGLPACQTSLTVTFEWKLESEKASHISLNSHSLEHKGLLCAHNTIPFP